MSLKYERSLVACRSATQSGDRKVVINEQAPDPWSGIPEEQAFEASLDSLFGEMNQLGQPAAMLQVRSACTPLSWLVCVR